MPRDVANQLPPIKDSTTYFGPKFGSGFQSGSISVGGLDLLTPPLSLHPGACRDILNFEVARNGGYARIGGYERYNGLPAPSSAAFVIVQVDTYVTVPSVGDQVSQASSGATGTIAFVSNAPGAYYMVLTKTAGAFDISGVVTKINATYTITAANPLTVTSVNSPFTVPQAASTIGTAITMTVQLTSQLNAQYLAAAADIYRADISPVPGSGPVLGVAHMIFGGRDFVYAFRANALGTAVAIWQSSAAGWVNIPLYNTIAFTAAGTAAPQDGDTLTQGGSTATIKRVMITDGTIAGNSAVGTFVVTTPGVSFAAGAATTSSGTTLTLSGAQTPIVLQPGGKYQFSKYNFSGQLITRRLYGCDGVNLGFEFDGTTYAPITTGAEPLVPSHIWGHQQHLFLSYQSSLTFSGPGTPFRYSAVDGGGEIATGDTITDLLTLPGQQSTAALGVWMLSTTAIVYGTGLADFALKVYNFGTGSNAGSAQNLYDSFVFADIGVVGLQTSLNYGNFTSQTLTKNIQPFIDRQSTKITTSSVQRSKGQYRVFFRDGYGLWLTFANQSYLGAALVQFPNPVGCIDDDTNSAGAEVGYFGATDSLGYVYQIDSGPSFDGGTLTAYFVGAFDYLKTPRWLKRFYRASIEIEGSTYAAIGFNYALGDNSPLIGQPTSNTYASSFSPALWDAATWDNFYWDGTTTTPTYADMTGTANDVQPRLSSGTNYIQPFTISSIIYEYSVRRRLRGM